MRVEDLQQKIAETSKKLQGRKVHLLLAITGLLIIATLFALLIGIIYLGAISCGGYGSSTGLPRDVCVSPGCLKVSAFMSKNMDSSVDACDNFYKFACDGWIQNRGIPTDHTVIDISHKLELDSERKWKKILEGNIWRTEEDSVERKIKVLYKQCMHDYGRMKNGGRTLIEAIRATVGEWYGFDPDNWSSQWNLNTALEVAHKEYALPVFFDYWVWPDSRDTTRNIINIYPSWTGMASYDYEDDSRENLRDIYRNYIRTMGYFLIRDSGLGIDNATASPRLDQFVDDVMDIETRQARIKRHAGRARWWGAQVSKLREMGQNYTQIDYVGIFSDLFDSAGVSGSTDVAIMSRNYFQLLDDMLADEEENKDRIINNFITWTFLRTSSWYLSWEYRYAAFSYYEARWGYTDWPPTWETCMLIIRWRFVEALAMIFYKKHIGGEIEHNVELLSETIRATLVADVDTITWMDNATKPLAKQKVKAMTVTVGVPPEDRDEREINQLYSRLNIDPDLSFFQNIIHLNEFALYKAGQKLSEHPANNLWRWEVWHDGFAVRPYFYWWYNAALVPTGAMQFPIYDYDSPTVYNYGALGTRLSNSMVHSIDRIGRLFVNHTYKVWWSDKTYNNYKKARDCVHDYYSNQTAGPYVINGEEKTVRVEGTGYEIRAVGRMAGLRVAYQSYEKWAKTNYEGRLPGMNMTNEQAFFLAAIQTRCAVQSDESAYGRARSGYLPVEMLMNGIVSHSTDFARVFKCPVGSKMNPEKKCRIF